MPEEPKKEVAPEAKSKPAEEKLSPEEEGKRGLLARGRVSLIIDSYDDLFSDFDSRDFSKRALSDDFLREAKKISVDMDVQEKAFEVRFLIPKALRKLEDEKIIRKRLKEHFRKHFKMLEGGRNAIVRKGALLSIAGFAMMLGATIIRTMESSEILFIVLLVVLEPAGWFSLWFGLDQIFYIAAEKRHDLTFYSKMSRAEIIFEDY